MAEKTLDLEIPLLLPGVEDVRDRCVERLEAELGRRKGILRAHVKADQDPPVLHVHYDPDVVSLEDVQGAAELASAGIANRYRHERIPVEGMDCSDCVVVIEHGLSRMDGVLSTRVSYPTETVYVEYDSQRVNRAAIDKRIRQLGYSVPAGPVQAWLEENRELIFSLVAGILLLVGWVGEQFLGLPSQVSLAFFLGAYFFGGYDITRHALGTLWGRRFNTDVLMVVAALGAAALGEFAEGALLLFLFDLGHALEERTLDRARNAIRALADLAPKTALVLRDGREVEVPVERVEVGDVVVVRPGVRLPVDGMVEKGTSAVNQAPITGESIPVDKGPGDQVFASSVNGEGALEVRVTRLASDTTLARVMEMVERAQAQKSPTQQLTERFVSVFVPVVLVGDLLLIVVPPLFGVPFQESFLRAMTLLVAASPCALALGTPSAILAGVAHAARNGVLVKGGVHLENLGQLRAVALDKTGTVTKGKPELTDVVPYGAATERELLTLAAAAETRSAHPLAQALVKAASERGIELPPVAQAEALTGRGIRADVDGRTVWVGNIKLFQEANIDLPPELRNQARELEQQGKTAMLVGADSTAIGLVAVADVVRPEAKDAVAALRRLGVGEVVMLTGDNPRVAAYIARQLGMTDYRAELLPEDKVNAVGELVEKYRIVAMVGDGVNDAPALAKSTVGIAMGGAATDVALETADVALMADDLSKLPFGAGIGRATQAVIRQNLVVSLGVIVVLMGLAISGLAGITVAIIFHEGSTVLVALNALRLLGYRGV